MKSRVIDQDPAVDTVHKALMRTKAISETGSKSMGVFLFAGPTGVGKTYFAKVLAELLYHNRDALIVVDLSHYKHEGDISQMFGAAPNYVGFNEAGGWLTREVKKKRGGILLLDEIDKAHPEILDSLLQMADEGQYRDNSTGETISVSEFMLIMTSNLGTREAAGEQDISRKNEIIKTAIKGYLKPEFLNRIDEVVVFNNLNLVACCRIANNLLKEHLEKYKNNNIQFQFMGGLIKQIVDQGYDPEMNARPMARMINKLVMSPLAQLILEKRINSGDTIKLDWSENKLKIVRAKAMSGPTEKSQGHAGG
jgi:ATP-dependent Clp protease ATP-binding subunit ClpB